ncbi:MAG: PHB depolymerase family esterase [Gemmataceae bacterium]|nr:PHB depolymerase family esterase [Gemmataceae bacterium]MDW8264388.1 PHB depolymerase family esterase [Gemmataceae bacterium]
MVPRSLRRLVIAGLAGLLFPTVGWADLIILKDGFTLHGKVTQAKEKITDQPSGEVFWVPSGHFMIDDGARRITFSRQQVAEADNRDIHEGTDLVRLYRFVSRYNAIRIDPLVNILEATPFDDRWERIYRLQGEQGRINVRQRLGVLTPQYARVEALSYHWSQFYLTKELGPQVVRSLLYRHPDLADKDGQVDPARRLRIVRFLMQAGWYDAAEQELNALAKERPDEQTPVEETREILKRLRLQQRLDDIERASRVGRHQWAQQQLADFPNAGLDDKDARRLRALRAKYDTAEEKLTKARTLLKVLPPRLLDPAEQRLFAEAAETILAELDADNVERLDPFLSFASLAERDRQSGKLPEHGPGALLGLAVSGWLLGSNVAEAKSETGQRLWRARQFVLDYQRTTSAEARRRLLEAYQRDKPIALDELARLIRFLPPPEPAPASSGSSPLSREAVGTGRRSPVPYLLQLPPEYRLGRLYPVLMVLHHAGEQPADILARFSDWASQYGYLLVAPTWDSSGQGIYGYSVAEHAAILEVLRDLLRRYAVDPDRVFLAGFGEGANLAYDVGLSHPDLFAGVAAISARPKYTSQVYWRNGQYLPFYVVAGELAGDVPKLNRRLFDQWVPRGYPSLYVEYKGRGLEWFDAEVPLLFEWMGPKRRYAAASEVGRSGGPGGEDFQTLRATDNRFWWLAADVIDSRNLNQGTLWDSRIVPAALQARIREGNQIVVFTRGIRQLSVWLGPGMTIDWDKPITIRVNSTLTWTNGGKPVRPNLATLLEDFYERGDRSRPYWAKVELPKL